MPNFDIVKKSTPSDTFRTAKIKGIFDLHIDKVQERFTGNIPIENLDWNIGLIVGNSGTGKTTIAKEVFGYVPERYEYKGKSVIDDMPADKTINEIIDVFNKVGFNSPPSWLKPYHVLSNGERMRVDLARAILSDTTPVIFDEFTSVVDRDVAKVMSYATQKAIRRLGRQFIAITPHFDVIDWLLPDWIFFTNDMRFVDLTKQKKKRPPIKIRICQIHGADNKRNVWRLFRKYHYLNTNLNLSAITFVMFVNDKMVGFTSATPFPHPKVKNVYRGHRTVILPDWQGIGLGSVLSKYLAEYVTKKMKKSFISTTSNLAFINARKKDKCWKIVTITGRRGKPALKNFVKGKLRKAVTFKYIC